MVGHLSFLFCTISVLYFVFHPNVDRMLRRLWGSKRQRMKGRHQLSKQSKATQATPAHPKQASKRTNWLPYSQSIWRCSHLEHCLWRWRPSCFFSLCGRITHSGCGCCVFLGRQLLIFVSHYVDKKVRRFSATPSVDGLE